MSPIQNTNMQSLGCSTSETAKPSPPKSSNRFSPTAPQSFAPVSRPPRNSQHLLGSVRSSSSNLTTPAPSPLAAPTAPPPDLSSATPDPYRKHSTKFTASPQFPQEKTTMTTASASDALATTASGFLREHLEHAQHACITSSFQAEDVVVLHMTLQLQPRIPVIFLETGYHFP